MTRAQALAYLKATYPEPAEDLNWNFTDSADEGRFAPVLDAAFRGMDIEETALPTAEVPDTDRAALFCLLRYHALDTFTRAFALGVDIQAGDPQTSKNYSQRYRAYKALLDQALKEAAALGIGPGAENGWETGWVTSTAVSGGEYAC